MVYLVNFEREREGGGGEEKEFAQKKEDIVFCIRK